MTVKSCTDCLYCKINCSKYTLRCIVRLGDNAGTISCWIKGNGKEKIIKLRHTEVHTLNIDWRDIFNLAQNCPSMNSMI